MADVIQLSDGTTTIDLYYDTTGFEMKADGNDFGVAAHDNVTHTPIDRDGEIIVRHRLENIEWPLALRVLGTDNDAVNDNINALGRLTEQARRYEIHKDVDKVYLSIQMDGCSNWTRFDVKDVFYDEIAAFNYYNIRADELTHDDGFSIEMVTHPTGYGAKVTLKNEIETSGLGEDHDSDNTADNWTALSGITPSFNTTNYLVGTQSQQIPAVGAGDGIESDTVSFSTLFRGEPFRAYVWVYRSAGASEITAYVVGDVSGTLDSTTYSDAITADITEVGAGGATWYKLELTGTIGGAENTVLLRVTAAGACTFSVDKAYLQIDTTYMPTEWVSGAYLANHYNSSRYFDAPTENTIPYLDIYGIRGDRDTNPEIFIRAADANTSVDYLKITNSAVNKINELDYYLQFIGVAGGASRSGGSYYSTTVTDAGWSKMGLTDLSVTEPDSWVGEIIVMASMNNSHAADVDVRGNFKFSNTESYNDNFSEVIYSVQGEWRLVTSGPIVTPNLGYSTTGALAALEVKCDAESTFADIHVDFALFAPISDGCIIVQLQGTVIESGGYCFVLDNENRKAYTAGITIGPGWTESRVILGRVQNGIYGRDIRLIPGRANKMFILGTSADNIHVATDGNIEVSLSYRPRTRFLLGDS